MADYAEQLGPALAQFCTVEANAENADIHLYHMGNNRLHEAIYERALKTPGVVVMHDAVLQHFMLGTRSRGAYLEEWVYNYGEWRRELGEELWEERARAATDPRYFSYPLLRRVVENARAVIVHNPGAAAMVREHGAKRVYTIPHFFGAGGDGQSANAVEAAEMRKKLGLEPASRLFGVFGYLREPKRVLTCIAAFRRLHAVNPQTALLLAGEVVSRDLERILASEAAHPAIHRAGRLSEPELRQAAAAIDCCLNLRYPAAGETSGIAIRMMGAGKPVIGTDNTENSEIPASALLRISPGIAEEQELFDHMVVLAGHPGLARTVGAAAREHIQRHHGLETVARQYREALCAVTS